MKSPKREKLLPGHQRPGKNAAAATMHLHGNILRLRRETSARPSAAHGDASCESVGFYRSGEVGIDAAARKPRVA